MQSFESEGSYIPSSGGTIPQLLRNGNSPASPFLDFPSLFERIGLLKRSLKEVSVPKNPGIRKSNRLHNSKTLFWIGVPERISRWWAWMHFTALVSFVFAFLMM